MGVSENQKLATIAVHAADYDSIAPAIPTVPPIHFASSFVFEDYADLDRVFDDPREGYAYARFGNPTVRSLETVMARLEGAEASIAYPSGMAAVDGVFGVFAQPGSHVIISRDVYGATLGLMRQQYCKLGVTLHEVDATDLDQVREVAAKYKPSLIHAEVITNPLMKISDIAALAEIAHANGAVLSIDNTFGTPMLIRPIELGADIVLHSTTKFIGGHGDVMGGIVSGNLDHITAMRDRARINGSVPGPMDAWLTVRGIHTLHLRMKAHSANALVVARWLESDDRIDVINYPGLQPDHLADQFLSADRGGLLSFEIKGATLESCGRYLEAVKLLKPATTLGDVSSVTLHPARASHRGFTPEERAAWGIRDNLLRVSVGIEDVDDIIADLDQAISAAIP
ncbi:MAG: aminotransferase class I/II-fold pyridoxal phosphate-dependent enzyme [Thermomicrobiales bacterium]|nr:aminotransferase class I/II-fold pyridoxal phosphate-dependent enzyme [Thermomicrobiales bacterium]